MSSVVFGGHVVLTVDSYVLDARTQYTRCLVSSMGIRVLRTKKQANTYFV